MKKQKIKKFNCSPKLNKEVVIPTRKQLLEIIEDLRPSVVNQVYSVEEMVELYGYFIGERFIIDVKHAESAQVEQNDIEFNAFYDSGLDEVGEVAIEIFLITNPCQELMIIDNDDFDRIARKIADTIAHEVIHMSQYRARDFLEVEKVEYRELTVEEEDKLYLSSPDEINAYAYNIANELLERHDLAVAIKKLDKITEISIEDSINLWAYVTTFSKDSNHPVIKRLVKRVYKSLIKLGK